MAGLLESLAELVAPTRCAGCDIPGGLLCGACTAHARRFIDAQSCPRCAAPFGALTCTECWETEFLFEAALALGEMDRPLARAIVLHKDGGERRLGPLFGRMLAEEVATRWPGWCDAVTWVPSKREALRRRGFDHAGAIASAVADALGAPAVTTIEWARGSADQRHLGRLARATNLSGAFEPTATVPARVLLVDDVMTTGATLDAAAAALQAGGAEAVRAAVVARAW